MKGRVRMAFEDGADDSRPGLSLDDRAALAMAPKQGGWRNIAGKIWNAPNTAVGLAYGGLGAAIGQVHHLFDPNAPQPKVFWRDNAVQFTNNPLGGVGAITLGNTTTWHGDPFDPADREWNRDGAPILENGHTYPEHETQHTYQGEQLGPLYLPSNLAGGLMGLLFDRDGQGNPDWHGQRNWNERGPQSDPPVPWAPRSEP
jgi:hypothetical protein